jgi:hypothetical protein
VRLRRPLEHRAVTFVMDDLTLHGTVLAVARPGLLYWPASRSWITVSRSAVSVSASRQTRPLGPRSSITR